jgi:FkbM family methyltransferase
MQSRRGSFILMKILSTAKAMSNRWPPVRVAARRGFRLLQWANHWRHQVRHTVDGITYDLDLNEVIESNIFYFGAWEPDTTIAIKKFVKPGDTVLDIGANTGSHALLFAKIAGPKGRVIAFEPMSRARNKLIRNAGLNSFCSNLLIESLGVGSACQRVNAGFKSSWPLFGPEPGIDRETIQVTTVDSYVQEHRLDHIDFIKVDVDGYEHRVMQGAGSTVRSMRPILMLELCKYSLPEVGDRLEDLVNFLFDLGYSVLHERSLRSLDTTAEVLSAVPDNDTINVICLPRS